VGAGVGLGGLIGGGGGGVIYTMGDGAGQANWDGGI
jgi:hypothetical protein